MQNRSQKREGIARSSDRVESYAVWLTASKIEQGTILTFHPFFIQSLHTHSRILRIALYTFIAIFSLITLGISAAQAHLQFLPFVDFLIFVFDRMINIHSARGYPRFYRVGRAPGGSAREAILVSFAASLWGTVVGGKDLVDHV